MILRMMSLSLELAQSGDGVEDVAHGVFVVAVDVGDDLQGLLTHAMFDVQAVPHFFEGHDIFSLSSACARLTSANCFVFVWMISTAPS